MELNLKNAIEIVPLVYKPYFGRETLYLMINESGSDFRHFNCRNGFLKEVQKSYPDVDEEDLKLFFAYYRKLIFSLKMFFSNYTNYHRAKGIYPNFQFIYDTSYNENDEIIGAEFEILNGLILPIGDPIWKTYFPPNYLNDRCSVSTTDEPITNFDKTKLPKIDDEFRIDFFELYDRYKDKFTGKKIVIENSQAFETVDLSPGLNKLFDKAVLDIYKQYFPSLTDKEILELIEKDKKE